MNELDSDLRSLIEKEKSVYAEQTPAPEAGWNALREHFEANPRPPSPPPRGGGTLIWLGAAALVLSVAATSFLALRHEAHPAEHTQAMSTTPTSGAVPPRAPTPTANMPVPDAPSPRTDETRPDRVAQNVPTPRTRGERVAPSPAVVGEDVEEADALALEMALLGRARIALNAHDAAQALSLIAEHARRYPDGVLAPERRALERRARCTAQAGDETAPDVEGCP